LLNITSTHATMLHAFILIFLSLTIAEKQGGNSLISGSFSRYIALTTENNLGTNFTPPTPAQIAAAVLDANHTAMIASGWYTQADATSFRANTISYFQTEYGINFTAGAVDTNGIIYALPFVMIPFATNQFTATTVTFDSDNLNRGAAGGWFGIQYGEVIFCEASGVFSGVHAGETYNAGDVLTRILYNLAKTNGGPPSAEQPREVLLIDSPYGVSKNVPGSQGYINSLSILGATDENGNTGFYLESITFEKNDTSGVIYGRTRVSITWS